MSSRPIPPDEFEALAGEYALGVLDGEELAEARALAAKNVRFRAEVGRWSGRLAPLFDDIAPLAPSAQLWAAIEQRLGAAPVAVSATAPIAANDNANRLRRRVGVWQGATAAAMALAASLALVLVTQPPPAPVVVHVPASPQVLVPTPVPTPSPAPRPVAAETPAPMIAMLGDAEKKGTMLVASWDPANRRLMLVASGDMPVDSSRAHELWVIPAKGKPRSLGTMPRPKMHMDVADAMARQLIDGATLAVSVEPMGGSPTGAPTGPVIASGKLERA